MLMQLVIGIILILVNMFLLVAMGAIGFILRRVLKAIDELPDRFAKVHARISDVESVDSNQEARIKNLEGSKS